MTAIVILNVVFAVLVVGGIVALLRRAIIADAPERSRSRHALPQDRRAARERQGFTPAGREALAARR